MTTPQNYRDLAKRSEAFAQAVREWVQKMPKTLTTTDDLKQVARSAGSVGANYIEAQEAHSKQDGLRCIRICRKEARESEYWFRMLAVPLSVDLEAERKRLLQEAHELKLIFSSIVLKLEKK